MSEKWHKAIISLKVYEVHCVILLAFATQGFRASWKVLEFFESVNPGKKTKTCFVFKNGYVLFVNLFC